VNSLQEGGGETSRTSISRLSPIVSTCLSAHCLRVVHSESVHFMVERPRKEQARDGVCEILSTLHAAASVHCDRKVNRDDQERASERERERVCVMTWIVQLRGDGIERTRWVGQCNVMQVVKSSATTVYKSRGGADKSETRGDIGTVVQYSADEATHLTTHAGMKQ
jgi:hypothetical protein